MDRKRLVLWGLVAALLTVGAVACREQRNDDVGPLNQILTADAQAIRQAGAGHGFVCREINGRIGCVCDENAPDSDAILTCRGMEKVCGLLGTGRICNPADDWCTCWSRL